MNEGNDSSTANPSIRFISALRPMRYLLWGVVIGVALGFGASELWRQDNPKTVAAVSGTAPSSITGNFSLVDHTGRLVTDEDYRGKWLLVFFGYTNCPDVCPTTMNEIALIMQNLGGKAAKIQPLFITVDPERDTPGRMAEYVAAFNSGITGLTGTPEQIEAAAKSFRVFYEKEFLEGVSDGYSMAHTTSFYLIDPDGRFTKPYPYAASAEEIADDLRPRL